MAGHARRRFLRPRPAVGRTQSSPVSIARPRVLRIDSVRWARPQAILRLMARAPRVRLRQAGVQCWSRALIWHTQASVTSHIPRHSSSLPLPKPSTLLSLHRLPLKVGLAGALTVSIPPRQRARQVSHLGVRQRCPRRTLAGRALFAHHAVELRLFRMSSRLSAAANSDHFDDWDARNLLRRYGWMSPQLRLCQDSTSLIRRFLDALRSRSARRPIRFGL